MYDYIFLPFNYFMLYKLYYMEASEPKWVNSIYIRYIWPPYLNIFYLYRKLPCNMLYFFSEFIFGVFLLRNWVKIRFIFFYLIYHNNFLTNIMSWKLTRSLLCYLIRGSHQIQPDSGCRAWAKPGLLSGKTQTYDHHFKTIIIWKLKSIDTP